MLRTFTGRNTIKAIQLRGFRTGIPSLFPCYTDPDPYVPPSAEVVNQTTQCFTLLNFLKMKDIKSKYDDNLSTMPNFTIPDREQVKLQCDYRSVLHDILYSYKDKINYSMFDDITEQLQEGTHYNHRLEECQRTLKTMTSRRDNIKKQLDAMPLSRDKKSKKYYNRQIVQLDLEAVEADINELDSIISHQQNYPNDLFTYPVFWNNFAFAEKFGPKDNV